MSLFYPDNDKRHARLVEIATDCRLTLATAKDDFAHFKNLSASVNKKLAAIYAQAGLTAPQTTAVDVLHDQKVLHGIATDQSVTDLAKIVVDALGGLSTVTVFAPAATTALVEAGAITEEAAGAVMFTVVGAEVTAGAMAGGLIAGLAVGAVVAAIGLALDAIEGAEERDELRQGIHRMFATRIKLTYAKERGAILCDTLQSVADACDGFATAGIDLTDENIEAMVRKAVVPDLSRLYKVDMASITRDLATHDKGRGSWTGEDGAGKTINLPPTKPIYISMGQSVSARNVPAVPEGLRTANERLPHGVIGMPVLKIGDVTYWPFSYADNRMALCITAFDLRQNVIGEWELDGSRYCHKIERDLASDQLVFQGQNDSHNKPTSVRIEWSKLQKVVADRTSYAQLIAAPKAPAQFALNSPTIIYVPGKKPEEYRYPVLRHNGITYWVFTSIDNADRYAYSGVASDGTVVVSGQGDGMRYIERFTEDMTTKVVKFIGQADKSASYPLAALCPD